MTAALVKQPIIWVESELELIDWCERWQELDMLAIDTEFMRSQTYYPIAGLIQVNDGTNNVLIDPTKISDFLYFSSILENESIVKVLHSCSEDLEVFQHRLEVIPKNVIDTQIAAAALGYGFSVGFANLASAALGVDLPKSETRSDWLQRPLSQAQIHYAAIDVEYLFALAKKLIPALEEKKRVTWIREECDQLLENFAEAQNPELSYQRVKSAWKLDARQLACLMELCKWRENKAQFRDVPRNRVVKENSLFQVALKAPKHISQLRNFEGMNERMIRADGQDIIGIVNSASELSEAELPEPVARPLGGAENRIVKRLREKVVMLAEELGIAPELLVKKRDYESLIRNAESLPPTLLGWRKEVVGEKLLVWIKEVQVSGESE